jgi:hypothetical protein
MSIKIISVLYLLISFHSFSQSSLSEIECRKQLETELIHRGLINEDVCVDFSDFPSLSIKLSEKAYQLGSEKSNIYEIDKNKFAVSELTHLIGSQNVKATPHYEGYSDGVHANFTKYDNQFFDGEGKKLDLEKVKKYSTTIKDVNTKEVIDKILKKTSKSKEDEDLLTDILRNHALAQSRIDGLCNILIEPQKSECLKKAMAYTSPLLIENRNNLYGKENCPERRGGLISFNYPETNKKKNDQEGMLTPHFQNPNKFLQSQLQFSSTLSLMNEISKHPEFKDSQTKQDFKSDKYFFDVEGDQKRFQDLFKKNPTCAKNKYNIDEMRRMYWSIQAFSENLMKVGGDKEKKLALLMQKGDFSKIQSDYAEDLSKAMDSNYVIDKRPESIKTYSLEKKLELERISLLRVAITGKMQTPLFKKVIELPSSVVSQIQYGNMYVRNDKNSPETAINNINLAKSEEKYLKDNNINGSSLQFYENYNQKIKEDPSFERYPHAPIYHGNATSAFDCLDTSNGMAQYLKEMPEEDLKKMLLSGVEKDTKIQLNYSDIAPSRFPPTFKDRTNPVQTRGWICSGCGSGVHVKPDGSVINLSRTLDKNNKVNKSGNSGAHDNHPELTNNHDLTLGSMKNLLVYEVTCPNGGCDCMTKLKNGQELSTLLKTGKVHPMVSVEGKLDKPFSKEKMNSCLFVPPVPHSCSVDPNGKNNADKDQSDEQSGTFCKLLKEAKENDRFKKLKPTPDLIGIKNKCKKISQADFPKSEIQCAPILKNNGKLKNNHSKGNEASSAHSY